VVADRQADIGDPMMQTRQCVGSPPEVVTIVQYAAIAQVISVTTELRIADFLADGAKSSVLAP
jgi:hypothetical protein